MLNDRHAARTNGGRGDSLTTLTAKEPRHNRSAIKHRALTRSSTYPTAAPDFPIPTVPNTHTLSVYLDRNRHTPHTTSLSVVESSSNTRCTAPHTITMSEALTTKQVAEHNTVEKGLYIIVDKDVYKLDSFVDEHPGGAKILKRVGGKDASKQFWKVRLALTVAMSGACEPCC